MLLNRLNVLQISQEMTVTKTPETAGVKGHFRHTVTSLKKLGVPANVSLQVITSKPTSLHDRVQSHINHFRLCASRWRSLLLRGRI